jgi:hypothetical protein
LIVDSSLVSSDDAALGRTGANRDCIPPANDQTAALCPRCQAKLIDPQGLGWCKECGYCKSTEQDKKRVPEQPPANDQTAALCPRCQAKLIDPQGLGWCKECGYCKSMEEDKKRVPEQAAAPQQISPLGVVEFAQMARKMPGWAWVIVGGMLAVAFLNSMMNVLLPDKGLARALWSTMQIAGGVLMIFTAQFWSLVMFAPSDDTLHFKDAILPGRLWVMTLQKLPGTRGQLWLASWGLACILSGIILVGGLGYWVTCIAKKSAEPPPATSTQAP